MALEDLNKVSGVPKAPEIPAQKAPVEQASSGAESADKPTVTIRLFNKSPRRFLYERNPNDPTQNKYLEPGGTVELPEAKANILLQYGTEVVNTATMVDEKKEIQKLRDELKSRSEKERELLSRVSELEARLNELAKNAQAEHKAVEREKAREARK
jgi:hypothetical protein